ncbi:MAG: hypothetical protein QOH41_953 [Blastocatellia bacterium]|jgi:hypothetical protein|nr:hypothetical protein [Blastocatellia bacterium]
MAKEDTQSVVQPLKTVAQLASEFVLPVPGGSNLINGDFKNAGLHAVLGLAAGALFGPIGVIAVGVNSFSKATTGRNLYEHLNSAGTKASA